MTITFDQYQAMAARTMNEHLLPDEQLTNLCMGLSGEAGEFVDLMKKHLYHGKPLDREKALSELGDVMWYLAGLATVLSADMGEDIAKPNIQKLMKRYAEGYSHQASAARVDVEG